MANKIFRTDEFAIEVISTGATIDEIQDYKGTARYLIRTAVIRLNHVALNDWNFSDTRRDLMWYFGGDKKAYEVYCAEQEKKREEVERKIADLLDFPPDSTVITKNMSEIFTVVKISEI